MTKPKDDFEAAKIIVETIEGFPAEDQKRIIRWAMEKVGLGNSLPTSQPIQQQPSQNISAPNTGSTTDIRSFIQQKSPQSDTHFATAVAYFYKFQAADNEKKEFITSDDLQEACRKADRSRMPKPIITLGNAHRDGLLDKGSERGTYVINTVGENLVAMALPTSSNTANIKRGSKGKRKAASKKTGR